jgi:hypothetical protein
VYDGIAPFPEDVTMPSGCQRDNSFCIRGIVHKTVRL